MKATARNGNDIVDRLDHWAFNLSTCDTLSVAQGREGYASEVGLVRDAAAEIRRLREALAWRRGAPPDGALVLLWAPGMPEPFVARHAGDGVFEAVGMKSPALDEYQWLPLPGCVSVVSP